VKGCDKPVYRPLISISIDYASLQSVGSEKWTSPIRVSRNNLPNLGQYQVYILWGQLLLGMVYEDSRPKTEECFLI
jgi:hypothetical protein